MFKIDEIYWFDFISRNENEFRRIFCAVNVTFLHFSRKRYGPTDGPTDGRTDGPTDRPTDRRTYPLIEMRGRI